MNDRLLDKEKTAKGEKSNFFKKKRFQNQVQMPSSTTPPSISTEISSENTTSAPTELTNLPRFSLLLTLKSGKQVSFSEGGDRAGVPVIFIPGASGNRMWTAIYDSLARENGIRLICFDRPGRGVSEHPKSLKDWSFDSIGGIF